MGEVKMIDKNKLTETQKASFELIRADLSFLYTVVENAKKISSNYMISLLPYIGVLIDGTEKWIKSVNQVNKEKFYVPIFTAQEQTHYDEMRSSIKLWDKNYNDVYQQIQILYKESDNHFSSVCKPIAKKLRLYDIYGVDIVNEKMCGNTILCAYYTPSFSFENESNGKHLRDMSVVGGKYIAYFNAIDSYKVDINMNFNIKDYGGFFKSPIGNRFSDKFILMSILCQINFIIYCVDKYVIEEIPTKLRFSYILYFYLIGILPAINKANHTSFSIDSQWENTKFRSSMAHYKIGVSLKSEEIIKNDLMFGLVQKSFNCDYKTIKEAIIHQLQFLAEQIESYLDLGEIKI